jgi:predicted outer membrane repeat protein
LKQIHLRIVALLCFFLLNGAFATDFPYSEWNLANYNGAYAAFNDGVVSVSYGGSEYWHVQLTRKNIELQNGKTYEAKFFLQSAGANRTIDVRIGRDGFPYDAFAEFGEVVASPNGQSFSKTFKMQSGNVSNARFEFNLGKSSGIIYLANVSLNCLDCVNNTNQEVSNRPAVVLNDAFGYVVVADTVDFRDNSMSLGDVFGGKLELGADTKIYGNVDVSVKCFLRERANISGDLSYASPCTEQNNVHAKTKRAASLSKPSIDIPNVAAGYSAISVGIDQSITLPPGNYGAFYANTRSKIYLSSGTYNFQNFYTEPDVKISVNLASGPVSIGVSGNVRFGDRNKFTISGGNPSEIQWNVSGKNVDMGTDGLYFGKFIAPKAYVRIPSRSHLVGGVYARKFVMEPQSTVSQEPRATEISHSEGNFGPFFDSGTYKYVSQVPLSTSAVEMFVSADNVQVKVNGSTSTTVELPSASGTVTITLKHDQISGFPSEAFSSSYVFSFTKTANNRIYWNPQTQCEQGCDGATAATAIGDFDIAYETAMATGREIVMAGGIWDVTENFKDGVVPLRAGFELVGYTGDIKDLSSASNLPTIFLGESSHIEIIGKTPRTLTGFWIANGYNEKSGGAISSESDHLTLKNVLLSANKSDMDGGALYSVGTLELNNVYFKNNEAKGNGGAAYVDGKLDVQNVIFEKNIALGDGGAIYTEDNVSIQNVILSQNESAGEGGAWYAQKGTIKVTNATIFDNEGKTGHSAVGGNATGQIYNSILWKNIKPSCTLEKCKKEVTSSLSINHSITETNYNGDGNILKDPKFVDESKPGGMNDFMSMSAGLTLRDGSPAIGSGKKDDFVPETDILGIERSQEIDMGAYVWYDLNAEYIAGRILEGNFVPSTTPLPVFEHLGDKYDIFEKGNGRYGRILRKKVPRSDAERLNQIVVSFTLVNDKNVPYPNVTPVEIPFFRYAYSGESIIFQTLIKIPTDPEYDKKIHGRYLIFTSDVSKVGIYGNVQVVPFLNKTDKLRGVVTSWEKKPFF